MIINPAIILENPFWILLSVLGIGALKASIVFLLCLAFRLKTKVASRTAIMLGQSGEFVFVIVALALANGLLSETNAQFFMIVTALSMMITPLVERVGTRFILKE
jgi:CPA2 family monovalent cation:H+ antiporter-2